MSKAIGVDWAGNGWVTATIAGGDVAVEFYPTVLNLWRAHRDAEAILVDMPIGLKSAGKRACDLGVASKLGGKRQGSVFLTPTREAVYAATIEAAKAVQEPSDFSIQNQVWAIVPSIRELDGFLQEFQQAVAPDQFLEAHPELCFAGFNEGHPIEPSKHTADGRDRRLAVLASIDPALVEAFEDAVETLTQPAYAPMIGASKTDDILDAVVLAATADQGVPNLERIPDEPAVDPVLDRPIDIVAPQPE